MMEASFVAAFLGGVLSLLAPCSALLLPAFFAYAFTSRTELFGRTLLFLAGLCTVFVPLGLGASLVASLLIDYRDTTVLVAGIVLIAFGVLEVLSRGFSLVPASATARFQGQSGVIAVYTTGLVYGMAGFCAGPLLGAVLTVAASTTNPLTGAALLFVYALGTAMPLFVLAYFWDRLDLGRKRWLRGRSVQIGPLTTHTNNLIAGGLFILLGSGFVAFQGGSAFGGVYQDLGVGDVGFRVQAWIADNVGRFADAAVLVLLLAATLGIWTWRRTRGRALPPKREPESSQPVA